MKVQRIKFGFLMIIMLVILMFILAGCVFNIDEIKKNPVVKDFLKDYPNADMLAVHLTKEASEKYLPELKQLCGEQIEAKEYFKVEISDAESGLKVLVLVDVATQQIECAKKFGLSSKKKLVDEIITEGVSANETSKDKIEKQRDDAEHSTTETVASQQQTESVSQETETASQQTNISAEPPVPVESTVVSPSVVTTNIQKTPIILHRTVKDCKTKEVLPIDKDTAAKDEKMRKENPAYWNGFSTESDRAVQIINLKVFRQGTYWNYDCINRYMEHCIRDGSFDSYYDEWCEYSDGTNNEASNGADAENYVAPAQQVQASSVAQNTQASSSSQTTTQNVVYVPNPALYPNLNSQRLSHATVLHRKHFTCDGKQMDQIYGYGDEEVIDLKKTGYLNYVCENRYQQQCILDGTFDGYYIEWCEFDDGTNNKPINDDVTN